MNVGALTGNLGWLAASWAEHNHFRLDTSEFIAVQARKLEDYLRQNADTEFGRAHGFDKLRDRQDYADRVPLRSYDDYEPWIDRIADGHANVLTRDPVKLFEPSSGSSGPAKLIPYTASLQAEIRLAVAAWVTDLFLSRPRLMAGPAYWSLSPAIDTSELAPGSRVPVGFDDDSAYLGGIAERLINRTFAVPSDLRHVRDADRFWHLTLLHLLRQPGLRIASVWHPSFLSLLVERLRAGWDRLLEDLESGTSSNRPALSLDPAPARARVLAAMGPDDVPAIWPKLKLISCWTDAHAEAASRRLVKLFPRAELQAKGLVATEAFVTIPYAGQKPLAYRSHFFEFVANDTLVPSWKLEPGQAYSVIVTTGGGLYRYRLGDLVEMTGRLGMVPCVRFIGKEDRVSDYAGEKISENFAAEILKTLFDQVRIDPEFAMLAVDDTGDPPAYVLYLEAVDELPPGVAADLENLLRRNPHYELCTRLGQLAPAKVVSTGADAFGRFSTRLSALGMRLGDIKPSPLSLHSGWNEVFGSPGD